MFFLCLLSSPWPQLLLRRKRRKVKGRRGKMSKFSHAYVYLSICWQPTCTLHIQPHFQNPSETIFKKENKTPQVFRHLELTNQHSQALARDCSGILPLSTLWRNNTDDSTAEGRLTGRAFRGCPISVLVWVNPRAEDSFQACLSQEASVKPSALLWRGRSHLPLDGGKVKRHRLWFSVPFLKHYLPVKSWVQKDADERVHPKAVTKHCREQSGERTSSFLIDPWNPLR